MSFPDLALRYLLLVTPLIVVYGLVVRLGRVNPKLLSMLWSLGNLLIVGWLVRRGMAVGGMGLARAVAYSAGAMTVVLVPLFASVLLFAGQRERAEE